MATYSEREGDSPSGEQTGGVTLPRPERRSRRLRAFGKERTKFLLTLPQELSPARLAVLAVLVIFLALSLATPLRAYFEQRSELEQLKIDIAHQEEKKAELQKMIGLYNNDDFIREQARLRLGMINKGETAWRIMDPGIAGSVDPNSLTSQDQEQRPWYSELWSGISQTEEEKQQAEAASEASESLPTEAPAVPTETIDPNFVPLEGNHN